MTEPLPNLNVKITGDSSDAVAAIEETIAAEKQLGDQSDKTNEKIKKNSNESSKASDDLSKAIQKSSKDGESAYTALGKAVDAEKAKLKELQAQFKAGGDTEVFGDIKKSEADLASLTAMAKSAGLEVGNTTHSVTGLLEASARDGETAAQTIIRSVDDIRAHIKALKSEGNGGSSRPSSSIFGDLGRAQSDLKNLMGLGEKIGVEFAEEGADAGTNFVEKFGTSVAKVLPDALSNPYVAASLVGVAAASAPAIAAVIGGAVSAGFGLGVIGVGALSLKNDPAVAGALSELKADVASVFTNSAGPLAGPLADGLNELDGAVKAIEPDLVKMFTAAAPAAKALFDGVSAFVSDAGPKFAQTMVNAAPAVEELAQDIPRFGDALVTAIEDMSQGAGNAQALHDVFTILDGTIIGLGKGIEILSDDFDILSHPGAFVGSLFTGYATSTAAATKGVGGMASATEVANLQFAGFVTTTDDTTAALNELIDSTKTWIGLAQGSDDSLLALDQAQTTFNKELKTGTKNWDESTAAGQKQVGNLNALNEKITGYYDSLAKGAPLTKDQISDELKATEALLKTANAAGATSAETATLTGEVSRLKDQLALIKSKTVQITAEIKYNERFTATYSSGAIRPGTRAIAIAGANSGVMSYANSGIPTFANSGDVTGVYEGLAQPAYRFAEKSTVNEAVIAQHGDDNRAISTLRTAAAWHDKELVDRNSHPQASGDVYITNVVTLNGKELSRQLIGPVQRANSRSSASIYGAQ